MEEDAARRCQSINIPCSTQECFDHSVVNSQESEKVPNLNPPEGPASPVSHPEDTNNLGNTKRHWFEFNCSGR